MPNELLAGIRAGRPLAVVEEHVAQGSAGAGLVSRLCAAGNAPCHFLHFCAMGYPSATYGSQAFHRRESGIDAETVLATLMAERRS
jgi:transketolase